jgi:hypothetical protein
VSSSRERVLDMLRRGAIDAAEAERLLASIDPPPSAPPAWLNPFVRLSPMTTLVCGLLACAVSVIFAGHGLRFDGFIDVHSAPPIGVVAALRDQLAAWILPSLLLWMALRVVAPVRVHEIAGVVGLAHVPAVLAGISVLFIDAKTALPHPSAAIVLLLVLLALALQLTWLFQGVRHAAGRADARVVAAFVIAVVVAEVASKLVVVPRA